MWRGLSNRPQRGTIIRCSVGGCGDQFQRLMARDFDRQVAEFQVRVAVLNGFTALSTPITEVVG